MNLAISVPVSDLKTKRNLEYLTKLKSSDKQLKDGKTATFTIEELEAMAK